jgi:creatinine amidohydrolase
MDRESSVHRSCQIESLTWPEVRDAVARDAGVIVPVGATEQHGFHLPIGTDVVLPTELARAVAGALDFLITPPLVYGCRSRPLSGGGQSFPGTISLSARTFMSVLEDVLSELLRQGFRRIAVFSWHMENSNFTYEAAALAIEHARLDDARVMVHDDPAGAPGEATMEELFHGEFPGWDAEHAAIFETSLMLHLRPELVLMDRAVDDNSPSHPPYDIVPPPKSFIAPSGTLWKATQATAEKGRLIWDEMVPRVIDEVETALPTARAPRNR